MKFLYFFYTCHLYLLEKQVTETLWFEKFEFSRVFVNHLIYTRSTLVMFPPGLHQLSQGSSTDGLTSNQNKLLQNHCLCSCCLFVCFSTTTLHYGKTSLLWICLYFQRTSFQSCCFFFFVLFFYSDATLKTCVMQPFSFYREQASC